MMKVFEDGDWYIHKYTYNGTSSGTMCLRHTACDISDNEEGTCSCNGYCDSCKAVAPDKIKGFFTLVKWKR